MQMPGVGYRLRSPYGAPFRTPMLLDSSGHATIVMPLAWFLNGLNMAMLSRIFAAWTVRQIADYLSVVPDASDHESRDSVIASTGCVGYFVSA